MDELQNISQNKEQEQWKCLNSFIHRLQADFSLMKQLLALIRITMTECTTLQKFEENT